MRGVALQRIVQEVIGAAEADPLTAPQAYLEAAQNFRQLARRPDFRSLSAVLGEKAAEFDARADQHLAVQKAVIDDFEEQENQLAEAYGQFGHHGNDMLVRARRSGIEQAASVPGAPASAGDSVQHVSVIPESVETARIGNIAKIKNSPTQQDIIDGVKETETLILWQDKKSTAQALTIDCGLIKGEAAIPGLAYSNDCRPYGIVEYGTDGYHNVVKFDVGSGTRFTVAGNYCSVLVGMDPPYPPAANGGGILTVGASLGFYAAPSIAPVTCTAYIENLQPGGTSDRILRPQKAVAILPPQGLGPLTGALPVRLVFYDWGGQPLYLLNFDIGDIVCPIPLTNSVAQLTLESMDPGIGGTKFYIPFQLAL